MSFVRNPWALAALVALGAFPSGARADEQVMRCRYLLKDKNPIECRATLRICPVPVRGETCLPGMTIECAGLEVYYESNPTVYPTDADGIGITGIGSDNLDFPHIAVDESLRRKFKDVFSHLYLTPWMRLAGKCSSTIVWED